MEKQDISINIGEHLFNFRVSALIKKDDKILIHHQIQKGHYTLPGGRVKEGESTIEALKREVMEEMGFETEYVRPVSLIENLFFSEGKHYHELLVTHEMKFIDKKVYDNERIETIEPEKQGKLEFLWISKNDIDKYGIIPIKLRDVLKNDEEFQYKINTVDL